ATRHVLLVPDQAGRRALDVRQNRKMAAEASLLAQLARGRLQRGLARLALASGRQPDAEPAVVDDERTAAVARIDGPRKGAPQCASDHDCTTPPSRLRHWPTCMVLLGLANQAIPRATSSAEKKRPIGTACSAWRLNSCSVMPWLRAPARTPARAMSVSTQPGATALTWMPRAISSSARALQRPITPCLAAQ